MRTTLTLDADVAQMVKSRMTSQSATLKQVVNQALRRGLSQESRHPPKPFRVTAHSFGLRPGIDLYKLNQLADEMETQDVVGKLRSHKKRG